MGEDRCGLEGRSHGIARRAAWTQRVLPGKQAAPRPPSHHKRAEQTTGPCHEQPPTRREEVIAAAVQAIHAGSLSRQGSYPQPSALPCRRGPAAAQSLVLARSESLAMRTSEKARLTTRKQASENGCRGTGLLDSARCRGCAGGPGDCRVAIDAGCPRDTLSIVSRQPPER